MTETLPAAPETRGGEHPDWDKAEPGEPLPERDGESAAVPGEPASPDDAGERQ